MMPKLIIRILNVLNVKLIWNYCLLKMLKNLSLIVAHLVGVFGWTRDRMSDVAAKVDSKITKDYEHPSVHSWLVLPTLEYLLF